MYAMLCMYNISLALSKLLGGGIMNTKTECGWIEYTRTGDGEPVYIRECKVVNGGKSFIIANSTRARRYNTRTGHHYYGWQKEEYIISIRDNEVKGIYKNGKMFRQMGFAEIHSTLNKGVNMYMSADDREFNRHCNDIAAQFLVMHGCEEVQDLIVPLAVEMGLGDRQFRDLMPWQTRVLQSGSHQQFWDRLCPKVKLARDEKRAILNLMMQPDMLTAGLAIGRIAGTIKVPNIRELNVGGGNRLNTWPSADLNRLIRNLRKVAPRRRLMFLNEVFGPTPYLANDVLVMLEDMVNGGLVDRGMNCRNIQEYHDRLMPMQQQRLELRRNQFQLEYEARRAQRELEDAMQRTEGRKINDRALGMNGTMITDDIELVVSDNPTEIMRWGSEQNHCIGTYARQMEDGMTLLLGFRRGDKWIAHCSIRGKRVEQLLAKNNQPVAEPDRQTILDWIKANDFATAATTGWG